LLAYYLPVPLSPSKPKNQNRNRFKNKKEMIRRKHILTQATETEISSTKKPFESFTVRANGVEYKCIGRTGKGSFGTVYKANIGDDNNSKTVAIKKVLQDPNYKKKKSGIKNKENW